MSKQKKQQPKARTVNAEKHTVKAEHDAKPEPKVDPAPVMIGTRHPAPEAKPEPKAEAKSYTKAFRDGTSFTVTEQNDGWVVDGFAVFPSLTAAAQGILAKRTGKDAASISISGPAFWGGTVKPRGNSSHERDVAALEAMVARYEGTDELSVKIRESLAWAIKDIKALPVPVTVAKGLTEGDTVKIGEKHVSRYAGLAIADAETLTVKTLTGGGKFAMVNGDKGFSMVFPIAHLIKA